MNITPYIKLFVDNKATQLILRSNESPYLIIEQEGGDPKKANIGTNTLTHEQVTSLIEALATEGQRMHLELNGLVRFAAALQEDHDHVVSIKSGDEIEVSIEIDRRAARPKVSTPDLEVLGAAPSEGTFDVFPYLERAAKLGGSDVFFTTDSTVKMKLNGGMVPLDPFLLTQDQTLQAAKGIMSKDQFRHFLTAHDLDFAISLKDKSARFRVNAFYQRGGVSLVLRFIPSDIPTVAMLNLPEELPKMVLEKRGLILIVGGTGSGKSTTMAAVINHRNENVPGHILTIEDPIEFSHPNKSAIINQREVGTDTDSYATALKASLREAPDVILIGEIRDKETMESALELSNTGHLCLATLHANNANQALDRVTNMFKQEQHKQLFMDLSANLVAVVSQRLIPNIEGKRSAAIEIMKNTPHVASLIMDGKLGDIKDAMESDKSGGTRTFDDALFALYSEGIITKEEAISNADSSNDLGNSITHSGQ